MVFPRQTALRRILKQVQDDTPLALVKYADYL
jgi:hypothetical protein